MERTANTKRPLSPHLQIYKPQLTSVLSISHRITGVILSIFSILIPVFLLFLSLGADYYYQLLNIMDHILVKAILAGTIFVVAYHLSNGVRHLFWDLGFGLSIRNSYISGYLVILISLAITMISFFI